jgi:hypothetical protein
MWISTFQARVLALRDLHYDNLQAHLIEEEFDTCPDGTKFFKHRIMEWRFIHNNKPLLRVETKNNINYWYEWEESVWEVC